MRAPCGLGRWMAAVVVLALLATLAGWTRPVAADESQVTAHVFWAPGCPHCSRAKEALREIRREVPPLQIDEIELGASPETDLLFEKMLVLLEVREPAVPFVVIGSDWVIGFAGGGQTDALYRRMIELCRVQGCIDLTTEVRRLSALATGRPGSASEAPAAPGRALPETVTVPWIGTITLSGLSLPALTVVLAGIDGFNPCAMWVLVFLIGLLLGAADSRRMWLLGGAFLLTTGIMYFAVMTAWLNVVLWIGAVTWLRIGIGALAVGAGLYYLREYWTNPGGLCRVTAPGGRRRLTDALRAAVERPSLPLAALAVAALAVIVNLIELVCSAGVPAIYTQLLAMHDLSPPARYGFILLYLTVFLIDDAAIFVTAMLTLRAAAAAGRYARVSHAVGGGVLLALGAVMILRPDWLG